MIDEEKQFAERDEWSDIVPIAQDDGPNPVVPIAYSQDFIDAMSYFRAVQAKKELSRRVLDLTARVIELSPGHYTVWRYRLDTVEKLMTEGDEIDGKDILRDELKFTEDLAETNPKSYQLWHHRQAIVGLLGDGSKEIEFINSALDADAKNHHAWTYRQWVVKRFNLFDQELDETSKWIDHDIRNNSAWNERFFVLSHKKDIFTEADKEASSQAAKLHVKYVLDKLEMAPNNECPWVFLRGLVIDLMSPKFTFNDFPEITKAATVYTTCMQPIPFANALLLRIYETEIGKLTLSFSQSDITSEEYNKQKTAFLKKSMEVLESLIKHDHMRKNYWTYRRSLFDNINSEA